MKQNLSVDLKINLDDVMFIIFKRLNIISKELAILKKISYFSFRISIDISNLEIAH